MNCRIYKDSDNIWNLIYYVGNTWKDFRYIEGKNKKQLLNKAKKMGFKEYFDGSKINTISIQIG